MPPSPSSVFKPKCATGFGLMGMTWRPKHTPDAQAFAAMKKAIAQGATFWSSGDYYGMPEPSAGLALIRRYFEAHPEDASKVTLFIKSCVDFKTMRPTVKHDQVIACADACIKHLGGAKKIDILGPTRVDPNVPLEETLGALGELVAAGKIGGVGISEAGAQTIEKANAIYPLSLVEVEFSLWTPDLLTNGVAATAKKLDIPLVAYSPLGRGFLTGQIKSVDDIPEGDIRRRFDRFQPEVRTPFPGAVYLHCAENYRLISISIPRTSTRTSSSSRSSSSSRQKPASRPRSSRSPGSARTTTRPRPAPSSRSPARRRPSASRRTPRTSVSRPRRRRSWMRSSPRSRSRAGGTTPSWRGCFGGRKVNVRVGVGVRG